MFRPSLECNHLYILGFKLIHVSKRGFWNTAFVVILRYNIVVRYTQATVISPKQGQNVDIYIVYCQRLACWCCGEAMSRGFHRHGFEQAHNDACAKTLLFLKLTQTTLLILPSLLWRNNGRDGFSYHQPHDCLFNRLFRRRSKKTSKLRVTGLCAGNTPGTGEIPAQMASNAENVSIWWYHVMQKRKKSKS